MRGRKKLVSLVALLSLLLAVPLVFSFGGVNTISTFLFGGSPEPVLGSSTALVFVDPDVIIKDYLNDPGYQIGNTFQVHINISDATDLFSWQVNVTWIDESAVSARVLNFTRIVAYGDFLARTASPDGTSRIVDVVDASNDTNYAAIAETILGEYPGITGGGRLVTIEFEVVGYGCSNITISGSGGVLPTMLLNSTGSSVTFNTAYCWFKNKLTGDANGDKAVNVLDQGKINAHWYPGPPVGALGYSRFVDTNDDGAINVLDQGVVNANWGRVVP